MTPAKSRQRDVAARTAATVTHRFVIGQSVRMANGFGGTASRVGDIYRITGKLPASGNEPQYRIRNENESHERVTTQDRLEALTGNGSSDTVLRDRTFQG